MAFPEGIGGPLQCTAASCTSAEATACAYVDRRQRRCGTAWCSQHVVMVDGMPYCRRHAGVVRAIGSGSEQLHSPPDLENRAPSLVSWVAQDVDADVRGILRLHADSGSVIDESGIMPTGHVSRRAWTRHWKVLSHTGFDQRVSLTVTEADDTVVRASVDGTVVIEIEPPWIASRRSGVVLSAEADALEREEFHRQLIEAVAAHLAKDAPGIGR
jgi:hypothetical protein